MAYDPQNPRIIRGKPDDELSPIQDEPPNVTEIERHPKKSRSYESLENEISQLRTELREHINPAPKKKANDVTPKKWTTKRIIVYLLLMIFMGILIYNGYLVFFKGYHF